SRSFEVPRRAAVPLRRSRGASGCGRGRGVLRACPTVAGVRSDLTRWFRLIVGATLALAALVLAVSTWRLLVDYLPAPWGDARHLDGHRIATRTLIAVGTAVVVLRVVAWKRIGERAPIPLALAAAGAV